MQYDSLRDYSLLTGIGIQVVDEEGKQLFVTDQYQRTNIALEFLANSLSLNGQVNNVQVKSLARSIEYGGLYTFLDPRGLTFITAPITNGSILNRFVIGGPIILSSIDDYLDFEFIPQVKGKVNIARLRELVSAIPVFGPKLVSAFSEQLFVNAAFISGGKMAKAYLADKLPGGLDCAADEIANDGMRRLRVRSYMFDSKTMANEQFQLLRTLQDQDELQAKVLMNEILEQILFHTRNNMDLIKSRVFELITIMAHSAMRDGADAKVVTQIRNRAYLELEDQESLDDIAAWMNQVFEMFSIHTLKNPNSRYAESIRRATNFMQEHFGDRITLVDVAKHVNFSPTYLCTLFRNETGQSFKAYLNRIRVEKSKELMPDQSLSIADISYKVGFADQSYFARIFKQHEGITPYHYRLAYNVEAPSQES